MTSNSRSKKRPTSSDTPREPKGVAPTYSPPFISIGKKERDLLRHLYFNQNKRFNVRDYARNIAKIPRSSVYDLLNRLKEKDLVNRSLANNGISQKGVIIIESQENLGVGGGVGASRSGCREINKLSSHFHKFKLPISDKKNFYKNRLETLNPKRIGENHMNNLDQIFVYFDDATIIINPKVMIITLYDIITDSVEESDLKSLSRAVEYAKRFMDIGIETEGINFTEEGHWARIQSHLSDFLYEKIDNKYFLDLKNGKKFWIDHSPDKFGIPKREDETNDKVIRERVDKFLGQVMSDDFDLMDINRTKEALGFITKLESARLMDQVEETKLKRLQLEKLKTETQIKSDHIPSYFG